MEEFLLRIFADYLVVPVVLVGGVALLLIPRQRRYQAWSWAVITGLLALLFAKLASLFYQGERPFEVQGVEPGAAFLPNPGFPSDHVLLVVVIACIVWASMKNKALSISLAAACLIIAVARVIALVHTPLDVIGGALCAIAAAICVYKKGIFTTRP